MKIYVDKITYIDIHMYFAQNMKTLINKLWLIKYKGILQAWHWKRLPVKLKWFLIPAVGRLRQVDLSELKAIQVYIMSSWPAKIM